MGINLGFENLGMAPKASGELSYEYLDSLIQFNQAASDVLDLCHELTATVRTYDNVNAISKCIKKYGVTRSLEALYGENFSSAASMEAENEEAKKGLGQKIKQILKDLWAKVTNFFKWLFNQKERTASALNSLKFKGPFEIKGESVIDGKITDEGKFTAALNKLKQAVNELGKTKSQLEDQLKEAQNAATDEYIQQLRDAIKKAVEDDRNVIRVANSFIAAAKRAGGADKSKDKNADQAAPEENAAK